MAAPSDLIAPASDDVYVYRGHCVARARRGCLKRAIHSETLRSAVAGHRTSCQRCRRERKPSGSNSSVVLLGQSLNVSTPERERESNEAAVRQLPQVPPAD